MRWVLAANLLLLCAPAATAAPPPRLVLAVGDCENRRLLDATAEIDRTVKEVLTGSSVLTASALDRRLAREDAASFAPIQERLERARNAFYEGSLHGLDETLTALLDETARLPPGSQRVELTASAHLLRALIFRNQGNQPRADAEALAVLRTTY